MPNLERTNEGVMSQPPRHALSGPLAHAVDEHRNRQAAVQATASTASPSPTAHGRHSSDHQPQPAERRPSGTSWARRQAVLNVVGWWPSHPAEPIRRHGLEPLPAGGRRAARPARAARHRALAARRAPQGIAHPSLGNWKPSICCPSCAGGQEIDQKRRTSAAPALARSWPNVRRCTRRRPASYARALKFHGRLLRRHRSLLPRLHEVPPAAPAVD